MPVRVMEYCGMTRLSVRILVLSAFALGLLSFACSPAASSPTTAGPTATPAATPTVTPAPTVAPTATVQRTAIAVTGTPAADRALVGGSLVSVDVPSNTLVILLLSGNADVKNKNINFRVDSKTRLSITAPNTPEKIVTSLADMGFKPTEAAVVVFFYSSYDPATKSYLLVNLARTPKP